MSSYPEIVIEYKNYNKNKELECPLCGWHGKTHPNIESDLVIDVTCPICDKILLVASFSSCY
jgi:rubrerythrin